MNTFKLSLAALLICVLFACRVDSKDGKDFQFVPIFLKTFDEPMAIVSISDDGNSFLAGGWVDKIRFWTKGNINSPPVESDFDSELVALQFVGESNQIYFANGMGVMRIFDSRMDRILYEYTFPQSSRYSGASDDGKLIAYGENIYFPEQNKLVPSVSSHAAQSSLQVSREKQVLTSGFHDAGVVVRDTDGNILADWKLGDSVQTSAMSSNGNFVAAGTEKGDCYLWQLSDKKQIHRIAGSKPVQRIHIDSAGKLIVIVTDSSITGFQVNPVKKLFSEKTGNHISASVLADNKWLAIGFDDGGIKLWDILQSRFVAELHEAKERITSIAINPTSKMLMFGSYDGYLGLYQVKSEDKK